MTNIKFREVFELTTYGNKEVVDWINRTYENYDLSREAAFATVRWLAKKFPEINKVLQVETTTEG